MKEFLLIDDLALNGWKSVIEKSVIKTSGQLKTATSYEEALIKIEEKFDLIFLDVRLTEEDHYVKEVTEYSGFKILKEIKKDFLKVNFSTPIILITASNKIWNIDAFRDYGVDSYYIKEHPDFVLSKENSFNNLYNLQNSFLNLLEVGFKRNEIWTQCKNIIDSLNDHPYFKDEKSKYFNIKNRIIDKIKLGYSQVFKTQTKIEKEILLSNNESLSFIIFFSILEEISKGFTDISETWDDLFDRKGNWKFRNKEYFIEKIQEKVNYEKIEKYRINNNKMLSDEKYNKKGVINLSEQIYSVLFFYAKEEKKIELENQFKEINQYRNKTDYIHSSVQSILTKSIVTKENLNDAFDMNLNVLKFINNILKLKIN